MIAKKHLCGVSIVYEPFIKRPDVVEHSAEKRQKAGTGRPQGSLISQQKRAIADAVEYLRIHKRARIFCLTTPDESHGIITNNLISKFTHNLRNGFGVRDYVWVLELTKRGFPHVHFVADWGGEVDFNAVKKYWSGLFGSDSKNSVRFGTAPRCSRCRKKIAVQRCACGGVAVVKHFVDSQKFAWYMAKYLGKSFEHEIKLPPGRKRVKRFYISQDLARASAPVKFESQIIEGYRLLHERVWTVHPDDVEREPGARFNPYVYSWKWTGHGSAFVGVPRAWKAGKK